MSKSKKFKKTKKTSNGIGYIILVLFIFVVTLCVACVAANKFSKSENNKDSKDITDAEKLPVCVFDDKGYVHYIIYNDNGDKLYMFDAFADYDLKTDVSNAYHIEFVNSYNDQVIVTNVCPDWCYDYYNGYESNVTESGYELVANGVATSGTNFGFDIWENKDSNCYVAIMDVSLDSQLVIIFDSSLNKTMPMFNRLDVVKVFLSKYF